MTTPDGTQNGRPQLAPRPLWRPQVDPREAGTFGRPGGVSGSFAPTAQSAPPVSAAPVVPEMLADAFGRPAPDTPGLVRPPDPVPQLAPEEPGDPWRDPQAAVRLGPPAEERPVEAKPERRTADRFTLRQALFERRLRPSALIGVLVTALLVGAVGGAVGFLLAGRLPATAADPEFSVATAQPGLEPVPGSVRDIASRVVPAVVSLEVRTGDVGDTGSGVMIDGRGYILTNNHVVSLAATDKTAELTVVFNDGKGTRVPGTLVGRDPQSDLAVVKVDANNVTVAQLGDSDKLAVGDPVIAIGSPLGLEGTVTTGIVSATHRPVRLSGEGTDTNAVIDAIQTDAAINPGNSGGALVDGSGAVIGINTAIRTLGDAQASGSIGLGFAIPINEAKAVAAEIIKTGKVVHPSLGVNAKSATDGTTDGAQVQNVQDGSPAAKAGIQEGDVIVKLGDRTVGNADELQVAVQEHEPGDTVPVELLRDGRKMTVQVTLGSA
jgi:putative serine protease PepD